MKNETWIVAAKRTPIGSFQGALASTDVTELGAKAIQGALAESQLDAHKIDEVLMGCVLPAGVGQAPARQASLKAEMPQSIGCTTLNKVCGSGMKTVMLAHDLIQSGNAHAVIAGGMENMSSSPYLLKKARDGFRLGHEQVLDHMFYDGLQDAYQGELMGVFAEQTAQKYQFSRESMDAWAQQSVTRAQQAIEQGLFKEEIVPVNVKSRRGDTLVVDDEQPSKLDVTKIPTLRPAFAKDGGVTAANSSSISDGASAMILVDSEFGRQENLQPLAKIVAYSTHARQPDEFTIAPVFAIETLLEKTGWDKSDVDLWEINEAFAVVTQYAVKALELDESKVNPHGGACALGHPIGASGNRILVTLIHALKQTGGKRGVASLCIGGGEATAIAIEIC
ncbi:thiolase family protein [Vibrio parahaemolyticus]|uniref:thiolase family protein n=1 Tax=Vibrio parahaemolyticus TaxID=670 RepID=UPI00035912CA|nr:thiolase family protein [Vibrio parahaemolyticus]AGQ96652.1 acetyl-CoA acetyltransferase [Vibrio parahaemolyticus O1:K33 str. CDC_K4557]EIN4361534.1 thiolase family protein [Vibrio parahaemolyticus]MDF5670766.1 thiolase family protein [Vibrio parahaemolyticus]MDG2730729.1 thiolase family protein [Vibrio parahaemolyticus]ODY77460.1 acetyl-CoA acetyltransferase [Vibrio parahaemolyticus]